MSDMQIEYRKLRAKGWRAREAVHAARTVLAWDDTGGFVFDGDDCNAGNAPGESVYCPGSVRLRVAWDDSCTLEDLKGDMFNRDVNPEIQESQMAREESEFEERVERDGVTGIIGEYWNGETWEHADSCWGFVGGDWQDSGYDTDIMRATLDAYAAHRAGQTLAEKYPVHFAAVISFDYPSGDTDAHEAAENELLAIPGVDEVCINHQCWVQLDNANESVITAVRAKLAELEL